MALSKKKRAAQYKDLDLDVRSEIADLFRLLGDPSRLGIVYACLGEVVSAGDIARMLKISPSLTSHHLRLLKVARLVRSKRKGKQIFYTAADAHVRRILFDMADYALEHEHEHEESSA